MSRRKHLVVRERNGKPQRAARDTPGLLAPAQVRRILDNAVAVTRDPLFGSMIGRLHLGGKITSAELAAGKHWVEVSANQSEALRSPKPPKTVLLDAIGGMSTDPDSESGEREVKRHARASATWLEGKNVLQLAGVHVERVVEAVCIGDLAPCGLDELNALRGGCRHCRRNGPPDAKHPRVNGESCYSFIAQMFRGSLRCRPGIAALRARRRGCQAYLAADAHWRQ